MTEFVNLLSIFAYSSVRALLGNTGVLHLLSVYAYSSIRMLPCCQLVLGLCLVLGQSRDSIMTNGEPRK